MQGLDCTLKLYIKEEYKKKKKKAKEKKNTTHSLRLALSPWARITRKRPSGHHDFHPAFGLRGAMVARRFPKAKVAGSIPVVGTAFCFSISYLSKLRPSGSALE